MAVAILVGCASESMPSAPLTEAQLSARVLAESQLPPGFETFGDATVLDTEEFSLRNNEFGWLFALNALDNVEGDCRQALADLWRSSVDTHAALAMSVSDWQDGSFDVHLLSTAVDGDITGPFNDVGRSCSEEQSQSSPELVYAFDQLSGNLSGFEVVLEEQLDGSSGADEPDPNYRIGAVSYGNNHVVVESWHMTRENFDEILEATLDSFEDPASSNFTDEQEED